MAIDTKKATSLLLTIPLLILTLGLFLAMLGTGAWGIVEAINQDPCGNRNLTGLLGCEVQISLTSQSGDQLTDQPFAWYNWMVVSTVVGLLWAVVTTLAGEALLWTVEIFSSKDEPDGVDGDNIELKEIGADATENVAKGIKEKKTITLNSPGLAGQSKQKLVPSPLRKLTLGGTFGLFFCLFFLVLGIMSLLWGIATAYGNTRTDNVVLATYVTVEILTAILLPIFFFISGILLAGILDFITWGRLDLRTLVPKFLPVVKFESGVETGTGVDPKDSKPFDYWVIEDTFYFEVKKRDHLKNDGEKPSFGDSFDRSGATWALTFIVCLGIHLPVAYFVDYTLDTQDTLLAPDGCDTIDSTYRCFEAISLEPAGCSDINGTVHCFKFLRFGVDVDIIAASSTAFAFFLVASAAFSYLFTVMKILLHIKPSRWWALSYIFLGGPGFFGAIALVAVWATGYVAPLINEITHFNIIKVAQLFMVCEYLFIVGLLLVAAEWWENVPVAEYKPKERRELVHYHDTSRGEVDKAASKHAKDSIAKDTKLAEAAGDQHAKSLASNA